MKLKTRFTVSNILMLLTPVLLIGFVSLCFLIVFAVIFPIRDAYRQMYTVTPITVIKIVTGFFTQNPGAVVYIPMGADSNSNLGGVYYIYHAAAVTQCARAYSRAENCRRYHRRR